jgi:hypothetical protein
MLVCAFVVEFKDGVVLGVGEGVLVKPKRGFTYVRECR